MSDDEEQVRRLEDIRNFTGIVTALSQLAQAQIHAMSGFFSHSVGNMTEMREEFTNAMAAIRDVNQMVTDISKRLDVSIKDELERGAGESSDD